MSKTAFLFAGQGSQYVGMGQYLYEQYEIAKEIFHQGSEILGYDLYELCISDPNQILNETKYTQPAILTVSVAALKVLESLGIKADYTAGLSLGEYAALVCSGVLSFADALELVSTRGKIMQEAVPPGIGAMAAVLGLEREKIQEICESIDITKVSIANYNCPGQLVIGGEKEAVGKAIELLTPLSKKIVELNVSGPFHTMLMKDAAYQFYDVLKNKTFQTPNIPIITNVNAKPISDDFAINLREQIYSSVYFEDTITYLLQQDVTTFIEIGPGTTLSGFVKFTQKELGLKCNVYSFLNEQSVTKMLQLIGEKIHA